MLAILLILALYTSYKIGYKSGFNEKYQLDMYEINDRLDKVLPTLLNDANLQLAGYARKNNITNMHDFYVTLNVNPEIFHEVTDRNKDDK